MATEVNLTEGEGRDWTKKPRCRGDRGFLFLSYEVKGISRAGKPFSRAEVSFSGPEFAITHLRMQLPDRRRHLLLRSFLLCSGEVNCCSGKSISRAEVSFPSPKFPFARRQLQLLAGRMPSADQNFLRLLRRKELPLGEMRFPSRSLPSCSEVSVCSPAKAIARQTARF